MKYRPEIDGLRAIAIVPVVLFHAGFSFFQGGFVGVDVFFVISGYLITTIILSDIEKRKFSIVDFYERRARRILPALFFVMLICLPMAWAWLLPKDMKTFCQSLFAVSVFSSNIFFWKTSGYFESVAELSPLLHTWSLAVEEQFYIIFPLLLLLLSISSLKKIRTLVISVIAIASLIYAERTVEIQPVANFYLLPARCWELLIGAFTAFYLLKNSQNRLPRWINEMGGIVGLFLIAYSIVYFDKSTPFPSFFALVPTLGAAFIILFSSPYFLSGKILSNKFLVSLGLISYSTYLWHQPLLVFIRHASLDEPSISVRAFLAATSFFLGYLTWRFVEAPFRNRTKWGRRYIFVLSAVGTVFFAAIGYMGHWTNGLPQRYSVEQRELLKVGSRDYKETLGVFGLRKCLIDYDQGYEVLIKERCVARVPKGKRLIVFGDSQAAHLMAGIYSEFGKLGYTVQQWTATSCRPMQYQGNGKRCEGFYNSFISHVVPSLNENDTVLLASRWLGTYKEIGKDQFLESLTNTFDALKATNAKVIVVANTPEFSKSPHHIMLAKRIDNKDDVYITSADFRESEYLLKKVSDRYQYNFLSAVKVQCNANEPLSCLVAQGGVIYFFDGGHLSKEGSEWLVKNMIEQL